MKSSIYSKVNPSNPKTKLKTVLWIIIIPVIVIIGLNLAYIGLNALFTPPKYQNVININGPTEYQSVVTQFLENNGQEADCNFSHLTPAFITEEYNQLKEKYQQVVQEYNLEFSPPLNLTLISSNYEWTFSNFSSAHFNNNFTHYSYELFINASKTPFSQVGTGALNGSWQLHDLIIVKLYFHQYFTTLFGNSHDYTYNLFAMIDPNANALIYEKNIFSEFYPI
ncbi:MAG: hypothetical protein K9W44_06175 [Candidatus Lokiarchaeota archaeon]|nr:hypothetical protein [Candidatus Harpocratesius repetitus]